MFTYILANAIREGMKVFLSQGKKKKKMIWIFAFNIKTGVIKTSNQPHCIHWDDIFNISSVEEIVTREGEITIRIKERVLVFEKENKNGRNESQI